MGDEWKIEEVHAGRMEEVSHELRHLNENVSIDAEPVKSMHFNRRFHTIEMIILPVRFQL